MPLHADTTAQYCPQCGAEVGTAEVVTVDGDLAVQGVFGREGAHLVVDGGMIKIFTHADAGESP